MQSALYMQITTACRLISQYIGPFAGIHIEFLPGAAPHVRTEAVPNLLVSSV